jgi:Rrf2 family transcriptional regulator, iron-sulfur cluster assembly transcription factor
MVLSKSFGYAIRGVLYLAFMKDKKEKLQLDEIAEVLNAPRYFLAKVMNKLVKEGMVDSVKGHKGGFTVNENTLSVKLIDIMALTGESAQFTKCVLQLGRCNASQPCPIHHRVESLRLKWQELFKSLTIEDLLKKDQQNFIESLITV